MKLFCNTCDGIFNTVDIRFTKSCDNDCGYCIEKLSKIDIMKTDVDAISESIIDTNAIELLILGGEPFLEIDKLNYIVEKFKYLKIYITTSLPITILKNWHTFEKIINNIDGLNVSINHHDYTIHNNSLCANSKHNRIELLNLICSEYKEKVRVCINLINGYIDNFNDLEKTIEKVESVGVKNIKINELCHSDKYVSFEKISNIKLKSPYANGCYSNVLCIQYPYLNIELKRSCFITEKTLSASFFDLLKAFIQRFLVKRRANNFCVIYENGEIKSNWV